MQHTTIKIVTANVQGLGDDSKRLRLLSHWSKATTGTVFLLTETNCNSPQKAFRWKADCSSLGFGSTFDSNTRSAIIWRLNNSHVVDPSIAAPLITLRERVASKVLKVGSQIVCFHSIYCPVSPQERPSFIEKLRQELSASSKGMPYMLGGDWNTVLDPYLDSTNVQSQNVGQKQLVDLTSNLQLTDPFRYIHTAKRVFTNIPPVGAKRRLDRFYVSQELREDVQSLDIWSRFHSTHHPVVMTWAVPGSVCSGPGFFKLSLHVINRPGMADYLTSLVHRLYKEARDRQNDIQLAWDDCKARLSIEVQLLSRQLAKHERRVTTDRNRSPLVGKAIRARLRPEDCGPSSVEVRLRQVRQNSLISRLQLDEGEHSRFTSDPGEMADAARKHFAEIFCYKPNEGEMDELLTFVPPEQTLGAQAVYELEQDYSLKELTKALRKCNTGRSPSHSGLPVELYTATWDVTGPILLELLNDMAHRGVMTPSQRRRHLNLAHKKDERHLVRNYRPLASIEADARILAQAHVQRLKQHISTIIHESQTGFIPARWIGTNISELQRVIDDEDEFPGIIASVDFSNAYDRLNHMYMEDCLAKFGFGPKAISWYTATFREIDLAVIVNGWLSETFRQHTGVSQGCPLACMLYSIGVEPLACMIRQRVVGLEHPLAPVREKLFADDVHAVLRDWNDFHVFRECLELFEEATNAIVNVKKSFLYPLGSFRNQRGDEYDGWRIETKPFRCLGITIGRGTSLQDIWTATAARVKRRIDSLVMYDLPIVTRCRIIQVYCYSMIYYVDRFTPAPFEFVKRIEDWALEALWRGRTRTISQARLQVPYKSGGFGLTNLYKQLVGHRALWICWLLQDEAYRKGPTSSIIWRINSQLVHAPYCVGMTRNRNTYQLEGGYRWNWTAIFTQPGQFQAVKNSTRQTTLVDSLPARWQVFLDAWNDVVQLKPRLQQSKAWHEHFCTAEFNRLNVRMKLKELFIGPGGDGPDAWLQMTTYNFRRARVLIDEAAYGDKPLIPIAWQKRFHLPAKQWLGSWRSLHAIRHLIPDEVDILHRIALYNLHPASQLAGWNNDDAHFSVSTTVCVLCLELVKETFEHLLCECPTSRKLWDLAQPPQALPALQDFICPPTKTSLVIRAFHAIYIFTVWKWARSRRFNNYGQQPKLISDLEIISKAVRIHTAWNRHSFVSATEKMQSKAIAKKYGFDRDKARRTLDLLPTGA